MDPTIPCDLLFFGMEKAYVSINHCQSHAQASQQSWQTDKANHRDSMPKQKNRGLSGPQHNP